MDFDIRFSCIALILFMATTPCLIRISGILVKLFLAVTRCCL